MAACLQREASLAYGLRAWNLNWPIRIQQAGKNGRVRLSTDFVGKKHGGLQTVCKFCKRFACLKIKHLRKSSGCTTSNFWTFWGSRKRAPGRDYYGTASLWVALWSNVNAVCFSVSQIAVITVKSCHGVIFHSSIFCVVAKYRRDKSKYFWFSGLHFQAKHLTLFTTVISG